MKDVSSSQLAHGQAAAALPDAKRTLTKLCRNLLIGLLVFGYGPAFTYGWLVWLLNDFQWAAVYQMYVTQVPIVGGLCVLVLPVWWYWPVHRALTRWAQGGPVDEQECRKIYLRASRLPWVAVIGSIVAAVVGYVVGTVVVYWQVRQPVEEILKTIPAIPLVASLLGAFCYFGSVRAMRPVLAWCSRGLPQLNVAKHVSLASKFLVTVYVLVMAILCMLLPAVYRMGQVIVEDQLKERAFERLKGAAQELTSFQDMDERTIILDSASLGSRGYVFAVGASGEILTPHPRNYTDLIQENLSDLKSNLWMQQGVWVDRFGQHRIVASMRLMDPAWTLFSIAHPADFTTSLQYFLGLSCIVILEIILVVAILGRYYIKGITTPLKELTLAAEGIAKHADLSQYVPVTTNDELSELAQSFNRMIEELQDSKANVEDYTRRLEESAQELSAVNQEMEDLLRVVSHDLRSPLINIQGFSKRLEPLMKDAVQMFDEVAEKSREKDDVCARIEAFKSEFRTRFSESLKFISKGVEKMDTLLSSLLGMSRVGRKADATGSNDLNEILDDVLGTFDHQLKERSIQVVRHRLPTSILCRRNEINQVFSNLLSNAIGYMSASGGRFIEIGAEGKGDHVECYIRDTGIGINKEDQERIFHMFTRLQAVDVPGEGIGLAFVRKILRSHGGTIWVKSQRGQGSTFTFTLPMAQPAARG